uniref:Uncharacterized protein n=1 Tax=Avian adenovirus 8 (strain ATCC A-2A) TaxID=66295 RepID=Q9Q9H5_ADEG8|nr:unknown [Fowl aviadenovirus 8]
MQVRTPFSSSYLIRAFFYATQPQPVSSTTVTAPSMPLPSDGQRNTSTPRLGRQLLLRVRIRQTPTFYLRIRHHRLLRNRGSRKLLPPSEATTPCDDLLEEDCWFAESSADYAPIPWNTKENTSVVIPAQVAVSPSQSTTPPAVMLGIAQKAVNRGASSKDHTSHIATGVTVAGIVILIALVIIAFRTKVKEPRPTRSIYLGVPPPDVRPYRIIEQ